jgi:hypothetical protein
VQSMRHMRSEVEIPNLSRQSLEMTGNGIFASLLPSKNFTSSDEMIEAKRGWANTVSTKQDYRCDPAWKSDPSPPAVREAGPTLGPAPTRRAQTRFHEARDHMTRVDPWPDPRHKILRFITELAPSWSCDRSGGGQGSCGVRILRARLLTQFLCRPSGRTVSTNTSCGDRSVTQRRKQRRRHEEG